MRDPRGERIWERGWEGHRDAQARRMASLSLIEKLDWLEQAHRLARRLQGQAGEVREGGPEGARDPDGRPPRIA